MRPTAIYSNGESSSSERNKSPLKFRSPPRTNRGGGDTSHPMSLSLTSPAFADGGEIPEKYTFDGANISPPLRIAGAPAETQSFVLIVEDIDSPIGPFTHWVLWNVPGDAKEIGEAETPLSAETGTNGFGQVRYGGPCPPSGLHRYLFRLYALNVVLDSTSPDRRDQIESDMEDNTIAETVLTGLYRARP